MKVECFVKEFACYKKRRLVDAYNEYGNQAALNAIKEIDRIVMLREKGLVTADEAVKMIAS